MKLMGCLYGILLSLEKYEQNTDSRKRMLSILFPSFTVFAYRQLRYHHRLFILLSASLLSRCSKLALPPKIVAHASLFFDGFLPLHKHVTFFTNISLVKFAFRIVLLPCKLVEFMRYLMNFSYVTSYKTTSLLVISIA